jgi:hypothetical protein
MDTCDMEAWRNDDIPQEQWHVVMAALGAPQGREIFWPESFPLEIFVRGLVHIWLSRIESEWPEGRFIRN